MSPPSLTVYQNGQGSVSADQLNTFMQTCATAAQLRNFVGISGVYVNLAGITAVNDGGQGTFFWNATAISPTDDNENIIVPPAASMGCWQRLVPSFSSLATDSNPALSEDVVGWNGVNGLLIPLSTLAQTGQCKLSFTTSTVITLSPQNGNNIVINSKIYQVPDAGVTLGNSGLSLSTRYYIYAYINSGSVTLEASTTAYTSQAGTGIKIKTGDATRSLVGLTYIDGTGLFQDSYSFRFTRSWFNEYGISGGNDLTNTSDTVNRVAPNYNELTISSATFRAGIVLWENERVMATYDWQGGTNGTPTVVHSFLGVNLAGNYTGSSTEPDYGVFDDGVVNNGCSGAVSIVFGANGNSQNGGGAINEGYNYLTMYAAVDAGTMTMSGNRRQTRISYITVRK